MALCGRTIQLVGELPEKVHSTVRERREISAAHKWNENSYTCEGPTDDLLDRARASSKLLPSTYGRLQNYIPESWKSILPLYTKHQEVSSNGEMMILLSWWERWRKCDKACICYLF